MVPDLDFDLTETERAAKDTAHRFAVEVLRPVGEKLDKLSPDEVIAPDSILWDVFKKNDELGLNILATDPGSDLSPLEAARIQTLISEEMGWGDTGLGCSLGAASFTKLFAGFSQNEEIQEKFGDNRIGSWGITEPSHGSDELDFDRAVLARGKEWGRPDIFARKDGNSFVITGQKSAWVSNGTISETCGLFCPVDLGNGLEQGGLFLVDLSEVGVTKGKPLDKIGQRALNQGEIFFEEVRVPADNMIVGPEGYALAKQMVLTTANTGMGALFSGLAKAAFEAALEYSKTRLQGGVPIIQHQSVQARIFSMYRRVEAAIALNRRVAVYNALSGTPSLEAAIMTKVTSTRTAFDVASDALQIFGGNGISKEYPIEKMFRDARISMIEDGCNDVLGLIAATRIAAE
jgi:alkylation response protein AidB-like acyl-CoA dehydrogenase